jgi:hypothetical protein
VIKKKKSGKSKVKGCGNLLPVRKFLMAKNVLPQRHSGTVKRKIYYHPPTGSSQNSGTVKLPLRHEGTKKKERAESFFNSQPF